MKENEYLKLLYQNCIGQISPQDYAHLQSWLDVSSEHQDIAYGVNLAWRESGTLPFDIQINLEEEYQLLRRRIQVEDGLKVKTKRSAKKKLFKYSIAASVLLLATIGLARQLFFQPHKTHWVEARTLDESKKIILSDGSEVYLQENSYLKYPLEFSEEQRLIQLRGKATLKVTDVANAPFQIQAMQQNSSLSLTNLSTLEITTATVLAGEGQLITSTIPIGVALKTGDTGTYNNVQNSIEIHNPQTSTIQFIDTPLQHALIQLELFFDISIDLKREELGACLLTLTAHKTDVSATLQSIATIFNMKIKEVDSHTYLLKKGSCE